jgi:hypothetical protein
MRNGINVSGRPCGRVLPLPAAATTTTTGMKKTKLWLSWFLLVLAIAVSLLLLLLLPLSSSLLHGFDNNESLPLLLLAQQQHPDGLTGIELFEHQVRFWQRAYSKKEGKHKISDHLVLSFGRAFNVNGV